MRQGPLKQKELRTPAFAYVKMTLYLITEHIRIMNLHIVFVIILITTPALIIQK